MQRVPFLFGARTRRVLIDVVAQKRCCGGGMTLRGVSYIIYDDNKPLSSCERRGINLFFSYKPVSYKKT